MHRPMNGPNEYETERPWERVQGGAAVEDDPHERRRAVDGLSRALVFGRDHRVSRRNVGRGRSRVHTPPPPLPLKSR